MGIVLRAQIPFEKIYYNSFFFVCVNSESRHGYDGSVKGIRCDFHFFKYIGLHYSRKEIPIKEGNLGMFPEQSGWTIVGEPKVSIL